jgi:Putative Ig domain
MIWNCPRGDTVRLLVSLAVASSLGACGSTESSSPASTPTLTPLSVSTISLPGGHVGANYSVALAATGGASPYHWVLASGTLPQGLALAASGAITGTPSAAANSAAIGLQVTDSGSPAQSSKRTLSLTIAPSALVVATQSLPTGEVGVLYAASVSASGGRPPYRWSIASGALAAGLSLSASGSISGTPTATSGAAVAFQVQDSSSPVLTQSVALPMKVNAALAVTTTSLPGAQVGKPYAATLTAAGGTPPLSWSLTAGSLPSGLALTPSSGVISGTPTAAVNSDALAFAVADSNAPAQHQSVNLAIPVAPSIISIAISPRAAALTLGQTASLSVTTNDPLGVTWSLAPAGGSFAPVQSTNGTSTTFTAPRTAGTYTITATSITDRATSNSIALGVTGLAGVFTYRNDSSRDGVNAQEYALTAGSGGAGGSVGTGTFGKLYSCIADGAVYAQPLWAANLTINGARHNVVFVASAHDSLFAFDADANPCVQLWSVSLIDGAHGAGAAEVTVPSGTTGYQVGNGYGDITPEVGVIGTPVIDSSSGTLYVVSKSMDPAGPDFYQRLHAIDVTTGNEKANSPVLIQGTYPGTGDNTTTTTFSAHYENQRTGLALINGSVYVAWAAHEDAPPYYGWIMGYTYGASGFQQVSVLNVTPNVQQGGIWMGGGAPSADASGRLYLITGNGGFDATSASVPNDDYGDSLLQLSVAPNATAPSAAFSVSQYFTPEDQAADDANDKDFGSGGAAVLANVTSGTGSVGVVVGGGKDGSLYILNQASLGGFSNTDAGAWQKIATGYHIFSTVSMWNDTIYLGPFNGPLTSYALQTSTTPSQFVRQARATDPASFGFPGPSPAISATGTTNGIVWALDNNHYCTNQSSACGPAVLHAYDATSLVELWNSSMAAGGADTAGNAVKFTVPSIANGKVYIGTRGNNTGGALGSTTVAGELDVYGLQPN